MKSNEVIIIGAGMAGMLTAYFLQSRGMRVIVLEAEHIADGQTGRTTAKITAQHGLSYDKLIQSVGRQRAQLYANANQDAIKEYAKLIEQEKIDCDFERLPAYVYSTQASEPLLREVKAAKELGLPARFERQVQLPFETLGAVRFEDQAQFHPLKFLRAIALELKIYENTLVKKVHGNRVYTSKGIFTAEKIVFATHYPIVNIPGFYFLRQHQERSYVVALAGCKELDGMYYSEDEKGLSLRSYGDILLVGGSSHRTGKNTKGGAYEVLRREAEKYFPKGREVAHWSAQDCMPHDGIPFIGRYSYLKPDWYVATGFQKWGMTTSMIAARLLADQITGTQNVYEKLYTPQRFLIKAGGADFLKDAGESIKGLSGGWMPWHKTPRCSHLGCALQWTPDEESWDCPCHGSRFDKAGNLLDEPARKKL